jgi:hypothetical protein
MAENLIMYMYSDARRLQPTREQASGLVMPISNQTVIVYEKCLESSHVRIIIGGFAAWRAAGPVQCSCEGWHSMYGMLWQMLGIVLSCALIALLTHPTPLLLIS